jgi:mono/diheme cytochrome c family protein
MKSSVTKIRVAVLLCLLATVPSAFAGGGPRKNNSEGAAAVQPVNDADTMRVQGEQRFRANCGRCHAAPQKFPPRMMATVLRHMRVRATITDEDMRLVLFYMTQ